VRKTQKLFDYAFVRGWALPYIWTRMVILTTRVFLRLQFSYRIAEGDNYPEAIFRAALALPEFLKQHPECAA
jgi:hypothetical protein